jgi:hypothetical protein
MKFLLKIVLITAVAAGICFIGFSAVSKKKEMVVDQKPLPTTALLGTTTISLEHAETMAEKIHGLSDRESLPKDRGLLFTFSEPQKTGIWMKNMHFPIDVLWLDENFKIVHIVRDMKPESYPNVFYPPQPAIYVLEINAGIVSSGGIKEGDVIDIR